MTDNPDNPMAAPLTRAEEIRLWGDEQAAEAAELQRADEQQAVEAEHYGGSA